MRTQEPENPENLRPNWKKAVCLIVMASQAFAATGQSLLLGAELMRTGLPTSEAAPPPDEVTPAPLSGQVLLSGDGPSCHAPAPTPDAPTARVPVHDCPHCATPAGRMYRSDCACGHDSAGLAGAEAGDLTFRAIGCAPGEETPAAKFLRTPALPPEAGSDPAAGLVRDLPVFRVKTFRHFTLSPEAPPPKG